MTLIGRFFFVKNTYESIEPVTELNWLKESQATFAISDSKQTEKKKYVKAPET